MRKLEKGKLIGSVPKLRFKQYALTVFAFGDVSLSSFLTRLISKVEFDFQ